MFKSSELLEKINRHIAEMSWERQPQGLYAPVAYVLSLGGKRLRPLLMLMAYNLYKEDVERIFNQATGIEVYHNYTLLHDDLMDKADRRRGKPTVHKVWGENTAILSGDAMLVLAYQLMEKDCPADYLQQILEEFSRTALEICEGQQYDMDFETRLDVREEEYLEMIRLKTSVLLAAALKIGAMLGGASDEDAACLYDFGMNLGVAFQLKDDWLDVYGDPAVFGKNIGGDILCNKKTYLLIQALEQADEEQHRQLCHWLEVVSYEPDKKIAAVKQLYTVIGADRWCTQKIAEYTDRAEQSLAQVSLPASRKEELKALMKSLMNRTL